MLAPPVFNCEGLCRIVSAGKRYRETESLPYLGGIEDLRVHSDQHFRPGRPRACEDVAMPHAEGELTMWMDLCWKCWWYDACWCFCRCTEVALSIHAPNSYNLRYRIIVGKLPPPMSHPARNQPRSIICSKSMCIPSAASRLPLNSTKTPISRLPMAAATSDTRKRSKKFPRSRRSRGPPRKMRKYMRAPPRVWR